MDSPGWRSPCLPAQFSRIYIYGSSISFDPGGTTAVQWQFGDAARANAIAAALDAQPYSDVAVGPNGEVIHRILWHGAVSPYTLFQFIDIQSTYLGTTGTATNGGTVSSTFCSWAYANGGPAMTTYRYGKDETVAAANNFYNYIFNQCMGRDRSLALKVFQSTLGPFGDCSQSDACAKVANMILNCTVLGDTNCGNNTQSPWWGMLNQTPTTAVSISPDRLGGLTRFLNEQPRPTTWAADMQHVLTWSAAGQVCGCYE
jgi:hypothetical protein